MKEKINDILELKYDKEILSTIMKIVSMKSVLENPTEEFPFGENTVLCLEEVLKVARSLGFKTTNVDNYCGYAEIGEGEEIVGILGHLDVVDVEQSGWDTNPFVATIKEDGYLYGRGVSDDKGPILTAMYAVKCLMDLGVVFKKRVRVIFGLNEESGMNCMKHYNKVCEPVTLGFTPDGGFPLIQGEQGAYQGELHLKSTDADEIISFVGGKSFYAACDEATVIVNRKIDLDLLNQNASLLKSSFEFDFTDETTTIKAIGKANKMGNLASGINAITNIFLLLSKVGFNNDFVKKFNEMIGEDLTGEKIGVNFKDDFSKTSLNVGKIDIKNNEGYFSFDIRYPVTMKLEDIKCVFNNVATEFKFDIVPTKETNSLFFDTASPLASSLINAFVEVTGDISAKPWIIAGGTYARSMKNVVAFGGMFIGEHANVHGNNERTPLESYKKQARIYANAILKLLEV